MPTRAFPVVEFRKDTYEIDEFDCASMFSLVGRERALVIDAGIGIGDFIGALERITDKPLVLAVSHGHEDHYGSAWQFGECYLNELDWECHPFGYRDNLEARKRYANMIAHRQRGEHPDYPYDADRDILHWPKLAKRLTLTDGHRFDLGGRVVTAHHCPGHSPGEMVFLDEQTRTLFAGDALNCNLMLLSKPGSPGFTSVERALRGLEMIRAMGSRYDGIFNGHHDYRPFGEPLSADVLPDAIALCSQLVAGDFVPAYEPSPMVGWPDQLTIRKGRTRIAYTLEGIHGA